MEWEWLKTGIGPLKDLLNFLTQESKTSDVMKKQLIRELRNNLNIFSNGFKNEVSADVIVDLLSNDAIKDGIKNNFKFRKLKPGRIEPYHIYDERNRRYQGWEAEKLMNIKKMNKGTVENVKNNISLMMSNLYYRMKLMADFIRSDFK